jgi:tyrosyl-tRNA synthetase
MIITDKEKIYELLSRGVEEVFIKEELEKLLLSGKQLRIKFGIDPTGPKIHIGRAIPLRKLRAFQDLGHQIVLIIGDFTARVGDASDKTGKRPMLTKETIEENLKDYKDQIGKIVDLSKIEFRYNSEWLAGLDFNGITELAEHFSVQQMLRRRNFSDRIESGDEISLREFLYPLMQGYDSVAINSDVEIGGFDQLFNLQAGRILQKAHTQPEQHIMTLQMLEGTDGRKMSTSWGNIITIVDDAYDMYGKIMSLRDDLITKYFLLCTDISRDEILQIELAMQNGENPMQYKKQLAREIVTIYHSADEAIDAQNNWEKAFSEGGLPDTIDEITGESGKLLSEILVENKLLDSKAEFRRLTDEGGIKIISEDLSEEKITDFQYKLDKTIILKVGKKKFVKVVI